MCSTGAMLSTTIGRWALVPIAASTALVGCSSSTDVTTASVVAVSTPDGTGAPSNASVSPAPPVTTSPATTAATTPPTEVTPAPTPAAPTAAPTAATTTPVIETPSLAPTALGSGSTPHQVPTDDAGASWGDSHNYPATDIFVSGDGGCGGNVVSPVNGTVTQTRTTDQYDAGTDNPAFRGGKSVTVIGNDGVRYYMSHFDSIDANVEPGLAVAAGDHLGIVGTTGRSSACHIHFGISPACPDLEWSVRRGVIDPDPFLSSWRDGGDASPVEEVQQWLNDNPDGCAAASADPNAADS